MDAAKWLRTASCLDGLRQRLASECIEWYVEGFLIDAFHRALKLGYNTDAPRRADDGELESLLAGDMATAWRVFTLTQLRHEVPNAPASRILEGLQQRFGSTRLVG